MCRCLSYPFPHRQMGGDCNGAAFVGRYFDAQIYGACRQCNMREETDGEITCQALEGREELMRCDGLNEHVRFEGIKLYGVNRPATSAACRRRR